MKEEEKRRVEEVQKQKDKDDDGGDHDDGHGHGHDDDDQDDDGEGGGGGGEVVGRQGERAAVLLLVVMVRIDSGASRLRGMAVPCAPA